MGGYFPGLPQYCFLGCLPLLGSDLYGMNLRPYLSPNVAGHLNKKRFSPLESEACLDEDSTLATALLKASIVSALSMTFLWMSSSGLVQQLPSSAMSHKNFASLDTGD